MKPRDHQVEGATWALETVREYGLAYLAWEERSGKTLTALLAVEYSKASSCLIVTKKKALEGWVDTLNQWQHSKRYVVINYESIHKVTGSFDFIIIDEAHHAIAAIGRPSKTWKAVAKHTVKKPIIYLSATPYAETVGQLYHQLKLSSWSPFRLWRNYYDFHRKFGIPAMIYTAYGPKPDRTQFRKDEVLDLIKNMISFKTRKAVGIKHEPSVNLIVVPLSSLTKSMIGEWVTRRVLNLGTVELLGDSDSKMRTVHYQLEGGTLKVSENLSILTGSTEKIDYIKANYEESKIAIMAHFIKERDTLVKAFPKALILSSDGHAEGVDLHKTDKLIIYSMSFKTSKYTQRLARQANHKRDTPIVVDVLVADKPGVGKDIYECVAVKKENFVKASYERVWK